MSSETQVLDDIAHLLLSCNSCWNKRQSKFIFYETHIIEQSLYTSRVTIYEKQTIKLCKCMMNLTCWLIFTTELQADHTAECFRKSITNN